MQTFKTSIDYRLSPPACARRCGHRRTPFRDLEARRPPSAPRSLADDEPPQLTEDWRAFRAKLVKEAQAQEKSPRAGRVSKANMARLMLDNPRLAAEGDVWCHPTAGPEKGGLLVATPDAPVILGDERYAQLVVLLIEHGDQGSIGLILNRPTGMVLGKGPSGMPLQLTNAPPEVQQVFANSRLYCGGFTAQHVIHLLGGERVPGSQQVVQGVFMGGELAAARAVSLGRASAEDFRFHAGALVWEPEELQRHVDQGCWYTAACSRALVLKQCLQLPTPLWREVLMLMGGECAEVAAAEADGDSSDEEEP